MARRSKVRKWFLSVINPLNWLKALFNIFKSDEKKKESAKKEVKKNLKDLGKQDVVSKEKIVYVQQNTELLENVKEEIDKKPELDKTTKDKTKAILDELSDNLFEVFTMEAELNSVLRVINQTLNLMVKLGLVTRDDFKGLANLTGFTESKQDLNELIKDLRVKTEKLIELSQPLIDLNKAGKKSVDDLEDTFTNKLNQEANFKVIKFDNQKVEELHESLKNITEGLLGSIDMVETFIKQVEKQSNQSINDRLKSQGGSILKIALHQSLGHFYALTTFLNDYLQVLINMAEYKPNFFIAIQQAIRHELIQNIIEANENVNFLINDQNQQYIIEEQKALAIVAKKVVEGLKELRKHFASTVKAFMGNYLGKKNFQDLKVRINGNFDEINLWYSGENNKNLKNDIKSFKTILKLFDDFEKNTTQKPAEAKNPQQINKKTKDKQKQEKNTPKIANIVGSAIPTTSGEIEA